MLHVCPWKVIYLCTVGNLQLNITILQVPQGLLLSADATSDACYIGQLTQFADVLLHQLANVTGLCKVCWRCFLSIVKCSLKKKNYFNVWLSLDTPFWAHILTDLSVFRVPEHRGGFSNKILKKYSSLSVLGCFKGLEERRISSKLCIDQIPHFPLWRAHTTYKAWWLQSCRVCTKY